MKKEYDLKKEYFGSIIALIFGLFFLLMFIFAILDGEILRLPESIGKNHILSIIGLLLMGGFGIALTPLGLYGIYALHMMHDFKLTITENGIFFPEIRDRSITYYDYSDMKSYEIVENRIDKKNSFNALEIDMKYRRRIVVTNQLFSSEGEYLEATGLIISNLEKKNPGLK